MYDYYLCGWRVSSEIIIPELVAWEGGSRDPDIRISLGEVAPLAKDATVISPFLGVELGGRVRLAVDDAADFSISGGCQVVVQPHGPPDSPAVRIFLLGTTLSVLCHQRGLFPLHASCVRWGNGVVAFSGVSGAGKSTMAAALRARGHVIVSDDVAVIEMRDGVPMVRPAFPRVKLWRDSMEIAGLTPDNEVARSEAEGKYHFRFTEAAAFDRDMAPLRAVYLLETAAPGEAPRVESFSSPTERLAAISAQVPRRRAAHALGRQAELFRLAAMVSGATEVRRLVRCSEPERIEETLEVLSASLE